MIEVDASRKMINRASCTEARKSMTGFFFFDVMGMSYQRISEGLGWEVEKEGTKHRARELVTHSVGVSAKGEQKPFVLFSVLIVCFL